MSPDGLVVTCSDGLLREVRLCLTRELEPRACGADVNRGRLPRARRDRAAGGAVSLPRAGRDLPPGGGALTRLHRLVGDALIWARGLFRAPLRLGVRLVAFDAEGRVFLVRHSYLPGWHLPGGAVEAGETARVAAEREAREEGGLILDAPPTLLHLYLHPTTGRHRPYRGSSSRAGRGARPAAEAQGLEIREAGFFDPAALPEATTAATRSRIAEALGEAPPADLW